MCEKHSSNRLYFKLTFQRSSSTCRQHRSARRRLLMRLSSRAHPERGGAGFDLHRQRCSVSAAFFRVTSCGLAWLHPRPASVCACERWRPCACEGPSPNAPLSLQKHLFRPPNVTDVCKRECCRFSLKECNRAAQPELLAEQVVR